MHTRYVHIYDPCRLPKKDQKMIAFKPFFDVFVGQHIASAWQFC